MNQVDEITAAEWDVWTTTARVVTTDPSQLDRARSLVVDHLAEVDAAASRFRADSEVRRIAASTATAHRISPVLADLVRVALESAATTQGAVDPTLGTVMIDLGYDNAGLHAGPDAENPVSGFTASRRRPATWHDVVLDGDILRLPPGTLLDLGATAKARTADLCACRIVDDLGGGALVSLGGDLRVAGAEPLNGWNVLVQDGQDQPASHIRLGGAQAVATSSTLHRIWRRDGVLRHHVVDPHTCLSADPVWRTVSVAAETCLRANTLSTYSVIIGQQAPAMLTQHGVAARLVDAAGMVHVVGGWPQ